MRSFNNHFKVAAPGRTKKVKNSSSGPFQSFLHGARGIVRDFSKILSRSKSSYFYFIPLSIYVFRVFEIILEEIIPGFAFESFVTHDYITPFIERFGVVYGIFLPLIVLRAWEQLDDIDREFDREADAVKTLYDEIFYLRVKNTTFIKEIVASLREYVWHVIHNYQVETKPQDEKINVMKRTGDVILEKTREKFKDFIRRNGLRTKEQEVFVPKLIDKLNEIVDIRGDRIAIASQRLFESLLYVALITSIIFVLPFYFVSFLPGSGLFDNLLTIGVTFLVIVIYLIIEDFDEPFGGVFKITSESWNRILEEMDSKDRREELENLDKPERATLSELKSRRTDTKRGSRRKKKSHK